MPSDGTGSFRAVCGFSHMNFDDPLAYPGQEGASHLHTYFGNTSVDAFTTYESLRTTGNSTCRGGIANRSGYWVPAVVDQNGVPQAPEESHFYYKTGYLGIEPEDVVPFPSGLRMLAGDPMARGEQAHAWWSCLETYVGRAPAIPNCGAGNHAVMVVEFPQCWDGVNLDSPDHRSHMAYPEDGACPSSHPVSISAITYNIVYRIPSSGVAGWRLTSDMYDQTLPGGYSAHGDWFDGWDHAVVNAWVEHCNNAAVDCLSHLIGDGREMY